MNKISKPGTRCRRLLRMGGSLSCGAMDGHKFVCFDPDVAPKPYIIANKIILESFTINESAPAVALTKPMSDSEEVFWEIYSQNFDTEHKKEDYPMFRITSPEFNIENLQNTSNQQHLNKTSRTKNDRIPNKEPKFDTLFKKPPKTNINYTRNSYIHFLPSRPMDKLCNVYSFGIGSDTTFDYALQHFGCKVFSFDMTIVNSTNTHVTPSWNFLTLGISNESVVLDMTMRPSGNTIVATLRTLEEIQEIFDRSDSTIDILKLDVEDNEWKIFDQLLQHEEGRRLLSRVNQMQLEIHLEKLLNDTESVRVQAGQYYESVLDSLHGLGFRLVHTFLNQFSQKYVDIRGHVIPIYRESLYIRRP
ncbi:uncharacterized protein LOC108675608 [Hyalella azteca]|uniref:Uncharacterized protein LOC108675608 n=1 Tax=Hyalella azteca TaxID=294128 RepID=A0A8B7NZB9_HYAAZ|nr:uncharacterized protein LOC108675608 [Hyalella azteca]